VLVLAESETFGVGNWLAELPGVDVPPTGAGFTIVTLVVPLVEAPAAPTDDIN
jgi:hypothetical protein